MKFLKSIPCFFLIDKDVLKFGKQGILRFVNLVFWKE